MPFPFSASIHHPCKIFQPFKAHLSWAGWWWMALGSAPPPTTSHQPCSTSTHVCYPLSTGTAPALLEALLPAAFWPAHKRMQMSPTSGAKTDCKLPCKYGHMLIAFPFLKKSDFRVGVRRKHVWVREGRACRSWSLGRSVKSGPDAQAQSRCWNSKGSKKSELVQCCFFFCRSGHSQGVKM